MCECAAPGKSHQISGTSSSRIGLSLSQVASTIGDGMSKATETCDLNSLGEEKITILWLYSGSQQIIPLWGVLPLGFFRSGDLSVASSWGEEYDERNTIRF